MTKSVTFQSARDGHETRAGAGSRTGEEVDLAGLGLACLPALPHPRLVTRLCLQDNYVDSLPEDLFPSLPSLQWLDCRGNSLERLPGLQHHSSLRTLLAGGNQIPDIPPDLHTAPLLSVLQLTPNPLLGEVEAAARLGLPGLLQLSRDRLAGTGKLQQQISQDSGVGLDQEEEEDEQKVNKNIPVREEVAAPVCPAGEDLRARIRQQQREDEEIKHFLRNKDLYCNTQLNTAQPEDEEMFDEYLYYYKSFHSPLLDKQYDGYSVEDITAETARRAGQRAEQERADRAAAAQQAVQSKLALQSWRDKFRYARTTYSTALTVHCCTAGGKWLRAHPAPPPPPRPTGQTQPGHSAPPSSRPAAPPPSQRPSRRWTHWRRNSTGAWRQLHGRPLSKS